MSKTMNCPTCEKVVSKKAASCPHCGHQFRSPGGINLKDPIHLIGVGVVILLAIGIILFIYQTMTM